MSENRKRQIHMEINNLSSELYALERAEAKQDMEYMVGKFYRIVYTSGGVDYTHITGIKDNRLMQNYFITGRIANSAPLIDIAFYIGKTTNAESFRDNDYHIVKEITELEYDTALDKAMKEATSSIRKAYNETSTHD